MNKKRVLLMDEMDGMAGNEDRGRLIEESFIFGRYLEQEHLCVGEQEACAVDGRGGRDGGE